MIRNLLFAFLLSFTLSVSPISAGVPDETLHNKCIYPVVLVRPTDANRCGSGVVVRSTKIKEGEYHNVFISCFHVATAYNKPYVVDHFRYEKWSSLKDKATYPVEWVHADSRRDLAVGVFISNVEITTAEIDFDPDLYLGTDVYRIGCGLGDEPRLDYGKVTALKTSIGDCKNVIRTSIFTLPGDSGSAAFHNYKAIGITQAIRAFQNENIFNVSYVVPMYKIKEISKEQCNSLDFVWTTKKMPVIPYWKLNFQAQYELANK
jgi:S1-C subfamily serine protease